MEPHLKWTENVSTAKTF